MSEKQYTNLPCELVRDILPLYIEGLASNTTTELVESHLAGCEQCNATCQMLSAPIEQPNAAEQKQAVKEAVYLKKIKKSMVRKVLLSVVSMFLLIAAFLYVFQGRVYPMPIDRMQLENVYRLEDGSLYFEVYVDHSIAYIGTYAYGGFFVDANGHDTRDETQAQSFEIRLGYRLKDRILYGNQNTGGTYYFVVDTSYGNEQEIYLKGYNGSKSLLLWQAGDAVSPAPDYIEESVPTHHAGFWLGE